MKLRTKIIITLGVATIGFFLFSGLFFKKPPSESLHYFQHNKISNRSVLRTLSKNHHDFYIEYSKLFAVNNNGLSSRDYCMSPQTMLFLHDNFLPFENPVVIDIGSGYGGCAKEFAFLGYEVFLVEPEAKHAIPSIHSICLPPRAGSFVHTILEEYNIIDNYTVSFESLCTKTRKHLINRPLVKLETQKGTPDSFVRLEDDNKIFKNPWNIVLARNVFQFMENNTIDETLKLINKNLSPNGLVIITFTLDIEEKSKLPLKHSIEKYQNLINQMTSLGFALFTPETSPKKNLGKLIWATKSESVRG